MTSYKVIVLCGNPHIAEEIGECIHSGFLWVHAVPKAMIAGFVSSPAPQHLIFADHLLSPHEASAIYTGWLGEQGS